MDHTRRPGSASPRPPLVTAAVPAQPAVTSAPRLPPVPPPLLGHHAAQPKTANVPRPPPVPPPLLSHHAAQPKTANVPRPPPVPPPLLSHHAAQPKTANVPRLPPVPPPLLSHHAAQPKTANAPRLPPVPPGMGPHTAQPKLANAPAPGAAPPRHVGQHAPLAGPSVAPRAAPHVVQPAMSGALARPAPQGVVQPGKQKGQDPPPSRGGIGKPPRYHRPPRYGDTGTTGGTSMKVLLGPMAAETENYGSKTSAKSIPKLMGPLKKRNPGRWIAGHLLNDNLGGSGISTRNLTPLTRNANSQHSGYEGRIKRMCIRARQFHQKHPNKRYWYGVKYRVRVSEESFGDFTPYSGAPSHITLDSRVVRVDKTSGEVSNLPQHDPFYDDEANFQDIVIDNSDDHLSLDQ